MRWKDKSRSCARWALSAAVGLLLGLLIAARWISIYGSFGSLAVVLFGGAVRFELVGRHSSVPFFHLFGVDYLRPRPRTTRDWYWWFAADQGGKPLTVYVPNADGALAPQTIQTNPMLQIPLWAPAVIAAIPVALLWRADLLARRRERTGHCPSCGYDRRGLAADAKCPECGHVGGG